MSDDIPRLAVKNWKS